MEQIVFPISGTAQTREKIYEATAEPSVFFPINADTPAKIPLVWTSITGDGIVLTEGGTRFEAKQYMFVLITFDLQLTIDYGNHARFYFYQGKRGAVTSEYLDVIGGVTGDQQAVTFSVPLELRKGDWIEVWGSDNSFGTSNIGYVDSKMRFYVLKEEGKNAVF